MPIHETKINNGPKRVNDDSTWNLVQEVAQNPPPPPYRKMGLENDVSTGPSD